MGKEGFSTSLRKQVRKEQGNICAICGLKGCLSVHHIIPKSHGGKSIKDNALGVCRTPCHDVLDRYALEKDIYYPEVTMKPGFWYEIKNYLPPRKRK